MIIKTEDGEEKYVEEHEFPVREHHMISPNSTYTDYEAGPEIMGGASCITEELAVRAMEEFSINVRDYGVEVIDPEADNIEVL